MGFVIYECVYVWVCICVVFVMCGCVYVWVCNVCVCVCMGFVKFVGVHEWIL